MTTVSKRRRSKLTEQQEKFVDAKMEGASDNAAAIQAGYPNATAPAKSLTVREELAKAREEMSDLTKIRRIDIIDGLMDGINIARMQADAGNVIKGWVEVSKILGLQAPEVKVVELTSGEDRIKQHLKSLPMHELLKIAAGEVIDGEFKEIH